MHKLREISIPKYNINENKLLSFENSIEESVPSNSY